MKTSKRFGIVAALAVGLFVVATSGTAIARKNAGDVSVKQAPKTSILAPLTAGECTGLGGKVHTNAGVDKCASGQHCTTIDGDGVIKAMCISEKKFD